MKATLPARRFRTDLLRRRMLAETSEFLNRRPSSVPSLRITAATTDDEAQRPRPPTVRTTRCYFRFSNRIPGILASLILIGTVFTAQTYAQIVPPSATDTLYMTEAVANVMGAAKAADSLSSYGYRSGTCVLGGWLTEGNDVSIRTTFIPGQRHLIIAGGDNDAIDVDVKIVRESDGALISSDSSVGPYGSVIFSVPDDAWYSLHVKLYRCTDRGSFVSVAILTEGGFAVPLSSLHDATLHLMNYSQAIMEAFEQNGYRAGFQSSPNQWAVYGAILRSTESFRIFDLNPGYGGQLYIAAGDANALDVDLALDANNPGSVIKEDTRYGDFPRILHMSSSEERYGITTLLVESDLNRPALVLTAALSVR